MGYEIRLSSKGQIVLPKDIRDSRGLQPGEKLMAEQVGRRIIIEPSAPPRKKISYEEFRRRVPRYEGPPVAVEDMTANIGELFKNWKV